MFYIPLADQSESIVNLEEIPPLGLKIIPIYIN